MIIRESARKSMLTDLRSISAVGGKKSVKAGGIQPAAVVERTFAWLKGFRSLYILALPRQFYGPTTLL